MANPYHYADNDPVNREDPLGLRTADSAGPCFSSALGSAACASAATPTAVCAAHVVNVKVHPDGSLTGVVSGGACLAALGDFMALIGLAGLAAGLGTGAGLLIRDDPQTQDGCSRGGTESTCDPECPAARQAQLAAEVSSSEVLKRNMVAAGVSFPPFPFAAHHIVAGNEPQAAATRLHLHSLCMGINEAVNGVFLRYTQIGTGAYHPTLHTTTYYTTVAALVTPTITREQARTVLRGIAANLRVDTFPY